MHADELQREARALLAMVANNSCSLAEDTLTLEADVYRDQARYAQEQQALFRRYPQFVGPSCLLPEAGDTFAFDDAGVPIIVMRRSDGSLGAFVNICAHRGAPLGDGLGRAHGGHLLRCPYHGWSYDEHGSLAGVPQAKLGFPDLDRSRHGLVSLPVSEQDGCIFVAATPGSQLDAADVLGGLGQALAGFGLDNHHLLGRKRVETAINWKLNMDTFHEFYHFAALHPESIATMSHSNICHYRQYGRNHCMSSPTLQIDELLSRDEASWSPRSYLSLVIYLFPNTVIFIVEDHFPTWQVYPTAIDRSVVYHSMYLPRPPADEKERVEREAFFRMINDVAVNEDYRLVERLQRGLDAGIDHQLVIGRNEPGVQNMHRQIEQLLNEEVSPG